jgi:excinuclease UvrABC nuclease subunit
VRYRRIHILKPAAQLEPPRVVTALEFRQAQLMPDYSGFWCYALGHRVDRHIWYAGQSESLLRRLDDHRRAHPEMFDQAQIYLIPVRDQAQADLVELELIDYYQPECNRSGRADDLRRITAQRVRGGRGRAPLDASQETV